MGAIEAIGLAVLQGLTEFLPVSSSGHLALGHWLFNVGGGPGHELPLDYVVLVHFGTLVAVVIYYRSDLARILADIFAPRSSRTGRTRPGWGRTVALLLVIATVPGAVGGYLLEEHLETLMALPWAVGIALLVTGTALIAAERVGRRDKSDADTTRLDALWVGLGQMVALVPGISRSGSCIAAGLARGFDREWAPRFAFLASVPIILGGTVFKIGGAVALGQAEALPLYSVCALVSAATGYLAIRWVIHWVRAGNLRYFALWCYLVGVAAIVVNGLGLL